MPHTRAKGRPTVNLSSSMLAFLMPGCGIPKEWCNTNILVFLLSSHSDAAVCCLVSSLVSSVHFWQRQGSQPAAIALPAFCGPTAS